MSDPGSSSNIDESSGGTERLIDRLPAWALLLFFAAILIAGWYLVGTVKNFLRAGEIMVQVSPQDGMRMVYVPAGEFTMGTDAGLGPAANADEVPQHTVFLDGYWIDQTEVSNAQFAAFLNEMGNESEGGGTWLDTASGDAYIFNAGGGWHPAEGYGEHPVVGVSWYGAQAYCRWTGRALPTEAQWEKAARGTDGRTFPWGNEFNPKAANVLFNKNGDPGQTIAVGSFPAGASPYGALDMAGNVREWVQDWYGADDYQESAGENPGGPTAGDQKVLRGGSAFDGAQAARASARDFAPPDFSLYDIGFRCALNE